MDNQTWNYLRRNKENVEGWFQRVDAEIFGTILDFQDKHNIFGGCVEIGVHHGKSFIPVVRALRQEELALCIDIFDDQSENIDNSGLGNFEKFWGNLNKFNVDVSRIHVFKGSSQLVGSDFILKKIGDVRFFSIDGGHWAKIVQDDLFLAEKVMASGGVIALDDYCRADWPEVTYGYSLWQNQTESDIVPFAVGSNKLYLCRKNYSEAYRKALRTRFLSGYFTKSYSSEFGVIDSYRIEPFKQDEENLTGVVAIVLKIFFPKVSFFIKKILRRN